MLFLVNDILDFAQIKSKTIMINEEFINIRNLLDECVKIMNFNVISKGIKLLVEVE
jgi:signal transduction histidine kinase